MPALVNRRSRADRPHYVATFIHRELLQCLETRIKGETKVQPLNNYIAIYTTQLTHARSCRPRRRVIGRRGPPSLGYIQKQPPRGLYR